LIDELDAKLRELATYPAYDRIVPRPGPPASEEQIALYEKHLGRPLPPSYRAFLSLHDGYQALAYPGDMLSIEDVMPEANGMTASCPGRRPRPSTGRPSDRRDSYCQHGPANNWAYLDPKRVSAKTKR
jgi:hypothetical protein